MSDTNKVILIGRLSRDSELKYLTSGTALCNFSIAVGKSIPPRDGGQWQNMTSFFDCVLWGKLAESKSQYLLKGKQVCITGALEQEQWEKDGQKRSKVKINVESVQLLADPRNATTSQPAQATESPAAEPEDEIPW